MEKKGVVQEFKEFITRGNVIDLAVGVIIGGAFTAIVNSLVNDMIMPLVGWICGGVSFADLKYVITPAEGDIAEAAIYYGNFIQNIVNFLMVAIVVFVMVKLINKAHKKKEIEKVEEPAKIAEDVQLLMEIRDLLKEK